MILQAATREKLSVFRWIVIAALLVFTAEVYPVDFSPEGLFYPQIVAAFYQSRDGQEAWNDARLAEQLLQAIAEAPLHGLNPENYHYAELVNAPDRLKTDAFLAYAHDLRFGRASHRYKGRDWAITHIDTELIPFLQSALQTGEIRNQLQSLAPAFNSYRRLQSALVEYRKLAATEDWPKFSQPIDLSTADSEQLDLLRRRLESMKDLTSEIELMEGIIRFQSRHGLSPDGIVGKQTIAALNIPAATRVSQIELNLERLRWLPREIPDPLVIVNIPAFELLVYQKNNIVDNMRVVVGRTTWCTPSFLSSKINFIILNPYWYVPHAIATQEIEPLLKKDPDYLAKQNIQMIARADGTVQLRQIPGPGNSLGRIKFLFPNCCDCYLHDSPERELFNRVLRLFSHGCIRLEDAIGLGDWILQNDGWSEDAIVAAMESEKTQNIPLSKPVSIFIVYFTAWMDADGTAQFRNDVYRKDQELRRIMGMSSHKEND